MPDTTTTPKLPSTPRELERAGRKLWREIARSGKYELRPDELRVLEDACREADLIDDLAAEAKGAPKMVRGSQGQDVINPLISELRQHRTALRSLLAALHLPDDDDGSVGAESSRSTGARKAAQARWGKTG